jgi:hypothetical protein
MPTSSAGVPAQPDELARQIDDAHGFPHVEHQHLPALADRGSLQHQARRLGDGHEIPNDLRVSHRHWAAARDLLLELRNHAAAGAQHVAEAHGHEARGGMLLCERRHHHLGGALGGAHHVGGIHGLVGADQHEALDTGLPRGQRRVVGAQRVVAQRGQRVALFHQRHVLERRRVKHHVRPRLGHRVPQVRKILHIADQAPQRQ